MSKNLIAGILLASTAIVTCANAQVNLTAETASAGAVTLWSMPADIFESEAMQKYMQGSGSAPTVLSAADVQASMGDGWTIVSEDDKFRASATIGGNVVHKDMDEQLAYDLARVYIATLKELMARAPYGDSVNFDKPAAGMCSANPITYHPVATRAWEEAGFAIPDCAKG